MAQSTRKVINAIAKNLRDEVPPAFPVRIHQVDFKDQREYGDASFHDAGSKSYFLIRLKRGMDPDLVLFVLVHEWAHCVGWSSVRQDYIEDHDPEWGVAYARCWKAVSGCP